MGPLQRHVPPEAGDGGDGERVQRAASGGTVGPWWPAAGRPGMRGPIGALHTSGGVRLSVVEGVQCHPSLWRTMQHRGATRTAYRGSCVQRWGGYTPFPHY